MKKLNLALVAAILLAVAFGPFIVVAFAESGDAWTAGWDHTNNKDEVRVDESGDLIPGVTNSNSLGTSSLKWAAVHVTAGGLTDSSVETADIADAAVTTPKLASDAVTSAKILDAQVTTNKLGTGAATTSKLADDSVIALKIADGAVTTPKLAAGSATTSKLADDSVIAQKIADGSVTTPKIGTDAVTTAKISFDGVGFVYGNILCVTSGFKTGVCKANSATLCDCQ